MQIRGRVLPVVDLRVRFGCTPGERALDTRIVVGQHGERVVGLLVDSAREVVKIGARSSSRRRPSSARPASSRPSRSSARGS